MENTCPLDGFEMVLFTTGSRGQSFPVCPYCYNYPPFDDIAKGMPHYLYPPFPEYAPGRTFINGRLFVARDYW
jgi:DNA topoisomerase-3